MALSFFIAKKYFLSKKKRSFINFISIISMLGIALGLTALIVVLSVFNGLEGLNRQIFKAFDPDLKISSVTKKDFLPGNDLIKKIKHLEGVKYISEVYQDKALARSNDAQMIVVLKGVDTTFENNKEMQKALFEGEMKIFKDGRPAAYVGGGVFTALDLKINDFLNPLTLLYPKIQPLNVLNPEDNINQYTLEVAGAFVLEQQYDNHVIVPIEIVESLNDKAGKRTAIEITLKENADLNEVKKQISGLLSENLIVRDRDEQNAPLLKAIKIEKLFIFIALFFIVGIASFNIFYSLSMLVIDKKDDIKTLSSIGATQNLVKSIFLAEGLLVATIGVVLGLILGLSISFFQQKFGLIKLGMEYALVDAYPVENRSADVIMSVLGIFVISVLASIVPASRATKFMINN